MGDGASLREVHAKFARPRAGARPRPDARSNRVPEATDYLYPGQLFVSSGPAVVMTILGSCVAICIWDRKSGVGGLNHFLLPRGSAGGASALRYGNLAAPELVRRVLAQGAERSRLRAKLFGGACVMENGAGRLGEENVAVARSCLEELGIPILTEDVGGIRGRKLICCIPDGDVWMKTV